MTIKQTVVRLKNNFVLSKKGNKNRMAVSCYILTLEDSRETLICQSRNNIYLSMPENESGVVKVEV